LQASPHPFCCRQSSPLRRHTAWSHFPSFPLRAPSSSRPAPTSPASPSPSRSAPLNEGLQSAFVDGYDKDRFDDVCDHLIVQERSTGAIVGTYRIQMGDVAGRHFGYYSEQEFCFAPYEAMRSQIVELGRACIHRDHRSSEVLHLLWRGLARYSLLNGGRYMMGCCSLPSLDIDLGYAIYESLGHWMAEPALQTVATAAFRMPAKTAQIPNAQAPKLLRAYLTIGAKICSEPAIDREFKTIDFLTILDLQTLHPRVAARFLEGR
jgi:putative hemolysin